MIHSAYSITQITSPIYEQISQKLLSFVKDEDTRKKMERYIIRRRI